MERITIPVPDAVGDLNQTGLTTALLHQVEAKHGPGWVIENVDVDARTIILTRPTQLMSVAGGADVKTVTLPADAKASDGPAIAARLEDMYPGYFLTRFAPFTGTATITALTDDQVRVREAVAAGLGVKAWDVQIGGDRQAGYRIGLPASYQPSKHDEKLADVATQVAGRPGWITRIDAKKLTCDMLPATVPTFPPVINYSLEYSTRDRSVFGTSLPAPGDKTGQPVGIEWNQSAWTLLGGMPGSGKSMSINSIITASVATGAKLAVVDVPMKSVDFTWCKDLCSPGFWGADSLQAGAATLAAVYEEGKKRARQLEDAGLKNWLDAPQSRRFAPILVVVDEYAGLIVPDPVPKGIPKDHPLVVEANAINLAKAMIGSYIRKIISQLRFVGVRMVVSTQVTNQSTGLPPSMKALMGNFILQGTRTSKSARGQIFTDEASMPVVPENVAADAKIARGVGVAQLEGRKPCVYKGFYADTDTMRAMIDATNPPTCPDPAPDAEAIADVFGMDVDELANLMA